MITSKNLTDSLVELTKQLEVNADTTPKIQYFTNLCVSALAMCVDYLRALETWSKQDEKSDSKEVAN